ncbi:hypothetical protein C8F04DRAFT_1094426, partial [Mycena alexandri]
MSPTSLANRYRLIYALCLLQIIVTVATIPVYPLTDALARLLLLSLATHASFTVGIMHARILPFTQKSDPNARSSHVDRQYRWLQAMVCVWAVCLGCFYAVKDVPDFEPLTTAFMSCASTPCSFLGWKCILLGLDVVIPIGLTVAFFFASLGLKHCAIALYGTEIVAAPQFGVEGCSCRRCDDGACRGVWVGYARL